MEKTRVAVYGTLRRGQRAYHMLESGDFIAEDEISSLKMFDVGSYPTVVPTDNNEDTITVEIYDIPVDILKRLDMYEGYPDYYDRSLFACKDTGDLVWVYHWNHFPALKEIKCGDWIEYQKEFDNV